jgi:DMSO/TMAO reductase YedYZ heme-binding membrane subunit
VKASAKLPWHHRLLQNGRFWILATGIMISVFVAGFVQLAVPSGSLQTIRIEQYFGFISLLLLYVAVLASPLTKVYPDLSFKNAYLHARRAIGVLAFYYALLHVYITFFKQLNGFSGIGFYNSKYQASLLFGVIAFGILFIMAATSLDWAIKVMHFKNWKLLHRLVYIACVTVILHIIILGPHFTNESLLGVLTYVAFGFLALLEGTRIQQNIAARKNPKGKKP